MRVLLVGAGGREHALAWKIAQSPLLAALFIAPGNPGTAAFGVNVPLASDDLEGLVRFAASQQIDLVVVGPEAPLAAGLVDQLAAAGIAAFGPIAAAAKIESSKTHAKLLMERADVPTAQTFTFTNVADALSFARQSGTPWVVKTDGLAAGKGVVVAETVDATLAAIERLGAGGARLLLEQVLVGEEISLIALCDGERALMLPAAQDHKRLGDGDTGPNTGGMGAYAPAPQLTADMRDEVERRILLPILRTMAADGTPFRGALYAGLMLTPHGIKVLEFNARFGDPETQALLPLIDGDLLPVLDACARGMLAPEMLQIYDGAAACVVLAAAGYPERPRRGDAIDGVEAAEAEGGLIFHAGTMLEDGRLLTDGGRVLGVTGRGRTVRAAIEQAYALVDMIGFDGMQLRRDIGHSAPPAW